MQIKHLNKLYAVFKGCFPFTLRQNGGCIPRVVEDVLRPALHPSLCCNGTRNKAGQREGQGDMGADGRALPGRSEKPERVALSWDQNDKQKSEMHTSGKGCSVWQEWLVSRLWGRAKLQKAGEGQGQRAGWGQEVSGSRSPRPEGPLQGPQRSCWGPWGHQAAWNGGTWDRLDVQKRLPAVGRAEPLGTGREAAGVTCWGSSEVRDLQGLEGLWETPQHLGGVRPGGRRRSCFSGLRF